MNSRSVTQYIHTVSIPGSILHSVMEDRTPNIDENTKSRSTEPKEEEYYHSPASRKRVASRVNVVGVASIRYTETPRCLQMPRSGVTMVEFSNG